MPRYVATTVLKINVDPVSGQRLPSKLTPSAPVSPHFSLPKHINLPLAVLICTSCAFLTGYVLLLAGVSQIIRHADTPPELS